MHHASFHNPSFVQQTVVAVLTMASEGKDGAGAGADTPASEGVCAFKVVLLRHGESEWNQSNRCVPPSSLAASC